MTRRSPRSGPHEPSSPSAARAPAAATAAPATGFHFRARLTVDGVIAVGPGKIALLEAIAQTGSIAAAARQLDMSYRRAWLLLGDMNRSLRAPVVDRSRGGTAHGGSELTPTGAELVATYRRIERVAAAACAQDIARLGALLRTD